MKTRKNISTFSIDKNSFVDSGEGSLAFPAGLTITDNNEQHNGTRYDIETMDVSTYKGLLTANHSDQIQEVIGKIAGLSKLTDKVVVNGINFALKENALARYAYNMITSGFLTDFSIETIGPWPDDEGVYHDSKLVGLSLVVVGNNKAATLQEIEEVAHNSIEESKRDGLDTEPVERAYSQYKSEHQSNSSNKGEEEMKFVTIKNNRDFAIELEYNNAAGESIRLSLEPGKSIDVSANQSEALKALITNAVAPQKEDESIKDQIKDAMKPLMEEIAEYRKAFNKTATEPSFRKAGTDTKATNELADMDWRDRHALQINKAWELLKDHNQSAFEELSEVNKFHLEELQKANKVSNAMTISDFGNFIISPELLTEIEGSRSNFQPLISRLNFRETLSLDMAWLSRTGDINMQEVELCDDDADGNLKPLSEYGATIETDRLHELAAVTPVCNAATRFLAADLLGDVAAGYRNDFDRKRAQLFIARLQQAVDSTGNTVVYGATTNLAALQSWIPLMTTMQESVMGGVYIFNQKTYGEMLSRQMGAGINADSGFGLFTSGNAGPQFLGSNYIVVPNELMPSLNSNETRSFVVAGVTVTINQAVFYVDLSTFSGRTSGGLNYDLSTEAAYEDGAVVKSAFQRNELVLRGSFFRGGAIRDEDKVVGMGTAGVS